MIEKCYQLLVKKDIKLFDNNIYYMNKQEFVIWFQSTLKEMYEIMQRKNADYTTTEDPFSNFRIVEKLGISGVEQWILVRMTDKISRISNLITREAKVKDESITDTLQDLANYSIILKLYIESTRKQK